MLTIKLVREKETKSMVRFAEPHDQPKLGTLYVPKRTLDELGLSNTQSLELELRAEPAQLAAVA